MKNIAMNRAELLGLLDLIGIAQLVGVEAEQLRPVEESEGRELLLKGRQGLLNRQLINEIEGGYEVSDELRELAKTMANPQVGIATHRETADDKKSWFWHFVTQTSIAQLILDKPDNFRLVSVSNLETVVADLEAALPLVPVPETIEYRADVPQEDADEISSLADGWDEVPALQILEADGLKAVEAADLFDDLANFAWWGRVDFLANDGVNITSRHRVLVIQGQERSWVASQDIADMSTLHIHTARSGDLEEMLAQYWDDIRP
jgi:hypothetical protein